MKNVLLLNAAVRKKGTSTSFSHSMTKIAQMKGHQVKQADLIDYFDGKEPLAQLKEMMAESDLIGITIPCYVDTLPYPSIECLGKLMEDYDGEFEGKDFFAIAQGGMPYLDVHQPCIETSRHFAKAVKMNWLGGLICGLGPLINGKPLDQCGWIGKKFLGGLELMMEDVLGGSSISPHIQKKVTITIPKILNYPMAAMMTYSMKKQCEAHGVTDFDRKPYL